MLTEFSRNAVLKTYSRRVNTTVGTSSSKNRRVSEVDDLNGSLLETNSVDSSTKSKPVGIKRSSDARSAQEQPEKFARTKAAPAITDLRHMNSKFDFKNIPGFSDPEKASEQNYPDVWPGAGGVSKPMSPPSDPVRETSAQPTLSPRTSDEANRPSGDSDRTEEVNTLSSFTSREGSAERLTHSKSSSATEHLNPDSPNSKFNHVQHIRAVNEKRPSQNVSKSPSSVTIKPPKNDAHSREDIVNTTAKRRVVDDTFPAAGSAPPTKKAKFSGIHNYFKPLPRSSSPVVNSSSTLQSSDSIGPPEDITPPSSPPLAEDAIPVYERKSQKRQRRRLTTRPALEPLNNMSYHSNRSYFDDDDRQSFSEIIGGVNDPARVRLAEAHLDEEEKDDLVTSQMVSPGNRPRSDSYRSRSIGNASRNMNSRPFSSPSMNQVSENLRRSASNPGPNRGGNQSFGGPSRGSRPGPAPFPSPQVGSYSEPGPSSFSNTPMRNRSVTTGNFRLYDHDEAPEYGPNRALYDRQNKQSGRDLAPYKPSHTMAIPSATRKRDENPSYQQLQLDLGVSQTITCAKCKMVYSPSLEIDKRHHDDYCRKSVMPELQQRIFAYERPIYEKIVHGVQHHIRVFGRHSTQAQRAHARQVLDATYQDLPGLEYSDNELASEVPDPLKPNSPNMVPRFKFYVYYIGRQVIGALLVERYHQFQSRQLVERGRGAPLKGKCIVFDRLWVSPSHRRLGYASRIADNARVTFIPGLVLSKEAVAMPEQTSMGSGFARMYFK